MGHIVSSTEVFTQALKIRELTGLSYKECIVKALDVYRLSWEDLKNICCSKAS